MKLKTEINYENDKKIEIKRMMRKFKIRIK
jgi:hypothetical protein